MERQQSYAHCHTRRRCRQLLIHTYYIDRDLSVSTKWTKKGVDWMKSQQYETEKVTAKPGEHCSPWYKHKLPT